MVVEQPPSAEPPHAVLVYFDYGSTDLDELFDLEEKLERVMDEAGVGELDGNEMATDGSDGTLFMYGPDADALFTAIVATLEEAPFMKGARVVLRYGPPDGGAEQMELTLPRKQS